MARSPVAISVGAVALALALMGTPGPLEAQSSGVLQATVRVTDFRSSLAALNAAQAAAGGATLRHATSSKPGASAPALIQVVSTPVEGRRRETPSEPVLVTIAYLD
jgi:hypothetical protein